MDGRRFDSLVRALTEAGTRRGVLRLVMALPVVGGLLALLEPEDADTKGRRKRRRLRHKRRQARRKRGRQKRKKQKQRCKAYTRARTCANRCGTVENNCGKPVDCGPCVCNPACDICWTCNASSGICEPDPAQRGQACGEPGQVCQADGTCVCDASSCAEGLHCQEGACVCDASCPDGCCDAQGQCQVDNNRACGTGGVACSVSCSTRQVCSGGTCIDCSDACPGCQYCYREFTGSWFCGNYPASHSCQVCTTSSTCDPGDFCEVGVTFVPDNAFYSDAAICGQPEGTGFCGHGTACQA